MTNPSADRRKHARIPVRIPAALYFKNQPDKCIEAEVLDLSVGGAFVHCLAPIALGDEILLEVRLSEALSETLLLEARVITAGDKKADVVSSRLSEKVVIKWARGSAQSGFGVEFTDLADAARDFVAKLVQYFEKQRQTHEPAPPAGKILSKPKR